MHFKGVVVSDWLGINELPGTYADQVSFVRLPCCVSESVVACSVAWLGHQPVLA